MGNGYNNQLQKLYQKSSFFPMLCRLSIKDVSITTCKDHSSSILDDPSSPKVSCIGQVKKNNKVISFPSSTLKLSTSSAKSTPTHHSNNQYVKVTKLKKFFSSKNMVSASMAISPTGITKSCRSRKKEMVVMRRGGGEAGKRVCRKGGLEVDIDRLDPPLPVVKKVGGTGGGDEGNLWQRRRFVAVKSLQIQQIHLQNNNCVLPTTV